MLFSGNLENFRVTAVLSVENVIEKKNAVIELNNFSQRNRCTTQIRHYRDHQCHYENCQWNLYCHFTIKRKGKLCREWIEGTLIRTLTANMWFVRCCLQWTDTVVFVWL